MMPAICRRAALLWVFVLAACTIQLAPAYDQALVEGLDQANTETLTLFVSLEDGSPSSKFGDYEQRYASVIGRFEALVQRARMRQIPPLATRLSRLGPIQSICTSANDPTACVNTSPAALDEVLVQIRGMRTRHRSSGLAPDLVVNFRNAYNTAIAQALTVENALKR
jgi:hypothetical protein